MAFGIRSVFLFTLYELQATGFVVSNESTSAARTGALLQNRPEHEARFLFHVDDTVSLFVFLAYARHDHKLLSYRLLCC